MPRRAIWASADNVLACGAGSTAPRRPRARAHPEKPGVQLNAPVDVHNEVPAAATVAVGRQVITLEDEQADDHRAAKGSPSQKGHVVRRCGEPPSVSERELLVVLSVAEAPTASLRWRAGSGI